MSTTTEIKNLQGSLLLTGDLVSPIGKYGSATFEDDLTGYADSKNPWFQSELEYIAEENNISSEVMEKIIGLCQEYFEPNEYEQEVVKVVNRHGYNDTDKLDAYLSKIVDYEEQLDEYKDILNYTDLNGKKLFTEGNVVYDLDAWLDQINDLKDENKELEKELDKAMVASDSSQKEIETEKEFMSGGFTTLTDYRKQRKEILDGIKQFMGYDKKKMIRPKGIELRVFKEGSQIPCKVIKGTSKEMMEFIRQHKKDGYHYTMFTTVKKEFKAVMVSE
ncbi:hypothetical protein SY212_04090 [Ligilactobacillus agilis]|uniref:Uncharacterized protein n=1 Tax=Ligilactobacillus agilis TaxID=1601 RepID=A0A6F9XJF5_9LACO|nr:hypothetical protein [Ligilactobacillus agilis]GET05379.1 hypothetical protein SY212_04090 [Ligilactobacillus agilis]